ncbi:MAG: LD-carboxypeptidase [Myxococcales bacterium]|nr:LD-carboxypeptidase [Myxococcales bacterium]MCB9705112.1 LD-carboxypeptidase [Myxococcales bacterium]
MTVLRPPALRRGARIHISAPSGPVPRDRFDAGLARLQAALPADYELADNLWAQDGYFAGDDRRRLAALQAALADPSIDAIIAARGGYGLTRILGGLDPRRLRDAPKLLVGFSDHTALLAWALQRAGIASIHGPVITQLGSLEDDDLDRLLELLRGEDPAALVAEEGAVLRGGRVQGRLIAGNLEVLRALIGTPHFPDLSGAILAIEEIGERPYRIDRALTQLMSSGALRGVRGIAVGQLIGCEEPPEGNPQSPSAHSVIVERLAVLGVPVVTGFPFGHDFKFNAALPVGVMAELLADDAALYFLEPVAEANATH